MGEKTRKRELNPQNLCFGIRYFDVTGYRRLVTGYITVSGKLWVFVDSGRIAAEQHHQLLSRTAKRKNGLNKKSTHRHHREPA